LRQDYLDTIEQQSKDRPKLARQLLERREDGRIKMYVTHRMLCLRREAHNLFVGGSYAPLRGNQNVAAFARAAEGQTLLVAAPVQIATLTRGAMVAPLGADVWRDQVLPAPGEPGRVYHDLFTGRSLSVVERDRRAVLRLAEVFGEFPVAALLG
jgi:(1->4)-alpha-D-glucan 1-alpha-D-glucosylmutase